MLSEHSIISTTNKKLIVQDLTPYSAISAKIKLLFRYVGGNNKVPLHLRLSAAICGKKLPRFRIYVPIS